MIGEKLYLLRQSLTRKMLMSSTIYCEFILSVYHYIVNLYFGTLLALDILQTCFPLAGGGSFPKL